MNSFAVRYCGRKFEQLQGKTTLNARYQVSIKFIYFSINEAK